MKAVTLGRIFVFLLFVCPSPYVFVALGGSATPAMLLGLGMFIYWSLTRVTTSLSAAHTKQPIRVALYIFLGCIFASTAAAYARVLPIAETKAPLRGITIALAFAGVCLFFADGLRTRADIDKIVTAIVFGGTFVAVIGILQYATGNAIAPFFKLPGLGAINDVAFISERNGLPRVTGTAYHPIEYAVILCAIWPFALRYAVMGWEKKARIAVLLPSLLITGALATALSRTAVIAFSIVLLSMWLTWSARRRFRFAIFAALAILGLFLLAPQVPQVLIDLFTKADQDVSISSRTSDYANATSFITHHFFFGRGYKTFDPNTYFYLDNQFLLSLIEVGIFGLMSLIGLMCTGITLARNVKHTAKDPYTRELGQCLAGSLCAILVCFATFDTLSFPMVAFTTMTLLGLTGALWRVNRFENGQEDMEFRVVEETDSEPVETSAQNKQMNGSKQIQTLRKALASLKISR